jgi:hypothetical protein
MPRFRRPPSEAGHRRDYYGLKETSVLKKFYQKLQARKRARALLNIRQEFAKVGYPLDRFRDSEIEAAITHWNEDEDIAAFTISAKIIYRILKRLRRAANGQQKQMVFSESK